MTLDTGNALIAKTIDGIRNHPIFGTHFTIYPEYPQVNAYRYPAVAIERQYIGEVDKLLGQGDILGLQVIVEAAFHPNWQIQYDGMRYGGEPLSLFLENEMRLLLDELPWVDWPVTMAEVVGVEQKNAIETGFNFYGFVLIFQINYVEG